MSKALDERLRDARAALDKVHSAVGRHSADLPREVEDAFRELVDSRADIDYWLDTLGARTAARQLLDSLPTAADSPESISFGGTLVKFHHVRLIGVQAYLVTNWALADRIVGLVGRVLCTPEAGRNDASPAQLVSHFIQKEKAKKTTAATLFESLRQAFGWPIGLSYAIRNHFVHDGAQLAGIDFFEGPTAASGFRISAVGWDRVVKRAEEYGVNRTWHRAGAAWPTTPTDDLRIVLAACERETDDALGVLLGSACGSLLSHVGFMVGED